MVPSGELRARVRGRVWQAFAECGATSPADGGDLTLTKDKVEALVDAIADGVLAEIDSADAAARAMSAEAASVAGTDASQQASEPEETLWQGRPFLSVVEDYMITSERIRVVRGLLGKEREDIELLRVQDVDHSQRVLQRLLGLGDITVRSADLSNPTVTLRNVRSPMKVHEILRRAMLEARKRGSFSFREEM